MDQGTSVTICTLGMVICVAIWGTLQPLNGQEHYLTTMYNYCLAHADRVAAGENIFNDLVAIGAIEPIFANMTCEEVKDQKQTQDFIDKLIGK